MAHEGDGEVSRRRVTVHIGSPETTVLGTGDHAVNRSAYLSLRSNSDMSSFKGPNMSTMFSIQLKTTMGSFRVARAEANVQSVESPLSVWTWTKIEHPECKAAKCATSKTLPTYFFPGHPCRLPGAPTHTHIHTYTRMHTHTSHHAFHCTCCLYSLCHLRSRLLEGSQSPTRRRAQARDVTVSVLYLEIRFFLLKLSCRMYLVVPSSDCLHKLSAFSYPSYHSLALLARSILDFEHKWGFPNHEHLSVARGSSRRAHSSLDSIAPGPGVSLYLAPRISLNILTLCGSAYSQVH